MDKMQRFDGDGYALDFESGTEEEERQFYVQTFPKVDIVLERRLHCTSCNLHIGASPSCKSVMRMHPVLRVTICMKCLNFYTSGKFKKGKDGSDNYCSWCGQGGNLYCCSKCPCVFCKKCIVRNFSSRTVKVIEEAKFWDCLSCSPQIMRTLRATYWAHSNYLEKISKQILAHHTDDDDIYEAMHLDPTTCCAGYKKIKNETTAPRKIKRRRSVESDSKKIKKFSTHGTSVLPTKLSSSMSEWTQAPKNDVVCAPEITMMFNSTEPRPSPIQRTTPAVNPTTPQPQPLAVYQQNQSTPIAIVEPPPTTYPLYQAKEHDNLSVQGFTIDLHEASKTDRLPNGRDIEVRQNNVPFAIQQGNIVPSQSVSLAPRLNSQHPTALYEVPQLQQDINSSNTMHSLGSIEHILQQNRLHQQQNNKSKKKIQQLQQQLHQLKKRASLQMQIYSKDEVGQAREKLQSRISSTQKVCQHTIDKLKTLMSSKSYKEVRNYKDVKGLHIRVSLLYEYTMDRLRNLYEFNQNDMKEIDIAIDAEILQSDRQAHYKSDDDDLKIVENTQILIDLDSDSETETSDHIQHKLSDKISSSYQHVISSTQTNVDAVDPVTVCITEDFNRDSEIPILSTQGAPEDVTIENDKIMDSEFNIEATLRVLNSEDILSPISKSSENFATIYDATSEPKVGNHVPNIFLTGTSDDPDEYINIIIEPPAVSIIGNVDQSKIGNLDEADKSINIILDPAEPEFERKDQTNGADLEDAVMSQSFALYYADESINHIRDPSMSNPEMKNQSLNDARNSNIDFIEPAASDFEGKDQTNGVDLEKADDTINDTAEPSMSDPVKIYKSVNLDESNENINNITKPSVPDPKNINQLNVVDLDDSEKSCKNLIESAENHNQIKCVDEGVANDSNVSNMTSDLAKTVKTKGKTGNFYVLSLQNDDEKSDDCMDMDEYVDEIAPSNLLNTADSDNVQIDTSYRACDMIDFTEGNNMTDVIDLCDDGIDEYADAVMQSDDTDTSDNFEDASSQDFF